MVKVSAKEAQAIARRKNLCLDEDGTSFYAYSFTFDELYSFDSAKERNDFVKHLNVRRGEE
jgi:hypothetical protein